MAVKINWDDLKFEFTETRSMYLAGCKLGGEWEQGGLVPFGNIPMHPAAGVINYGQGLFEGMKAQQASDGSIVFFRPEDHAKRLQHGAKRMCIPPVPVELFLKAIMAVVKDNRDYVPPMGKGALYVRPALWGTGPILGVSPAPTFTFCVFCSPVGPYFKGGMKPTKMRVATDFHRAAPLGIGGVKAIGNYSATIYPGRLAKEQGFSENIYLNAGNNKTVEEVGAANFFCVMKGELHTPRLSGSILPGITRDSILMLAREKLKIKTQEREIDYHELPNADEMFCSGTAAVITPIGSITFDGQEYIINECKLGETTKKLYEMLTGIQTKKAADPYGWVVEVK